MANVSAIEAEVKAPNVAGPQKTITKTLRVHEIPLKRTHPRTETTNRRPRDDASA
jgi:hypothetical protein